MAKEPELGDPAKSIVIALMLIANNPELPEWSRKHLTTLAAETRAEFLRMKTETYDARRSAGGTHVKIATMGRTIKGLEARLEELEGQVHA